MSYDRAVANFEGLSLVLNETREIFMTEREASVIALHLSLLYNMGGNEAFVVSSNLPESIEYVKSNQRTTWIILRNGEDYRVSTIELLVLFREMLEGRNVKP